MYMKLYKMKQEKSVFFNKLKKKMSFLIIN